MIGWGRWCCCVMWWFLKLVYLLPWLFIVPVYCQTADSWLSGEKGIATTACDVAGNATGSNEEYQNQITVLFRYFNLYITNMVAVVLGIALYFCIQKNDLFRINKKTMSVIQSLPRRSAGASKSKKGFLLILCAAMQSIRISWKRC